MQPQFQDQTCDYRGVESNYTSVRPMKLSQKVANEKLSIMKKKVHAQKIPLVA